MNTGTAIKNIHMNRIAATLEVLYFSVQDLADKRAVPTDKTIEYNLFSLFSMSSSTCPFIVGISFSAEL